MNENEYKIRNLESSILYLQDQHAATLKLLHEEIKNLQMKNSELSFEITMKNQIPESPVVQISDQVTLQELISQIENLQFQVGSINHTLEEKMNMLKEYQTTITSLNHTIDKMKQSHKQKLAELHINLDDKSKEIANLSAKLVNYNVNKIHCTVKSDNTCPTGEHRDSISTSVIQQPIIPKTFKFRNQISVHPESSHVKCRPIIARQTLISSSTPVKSNSNTPSSPTPYSSPSPEFAIARQNVSYQSRSIRQLTILPPITPNKTNSNSYANQRQLDEGSIKKVKSSKKFNNSTLNQSPKVNQTHFVNSTDDFNSNSNRNNNQPQNNSQLIELEQVDHLVDFNNSALLYP